ncbi:MAG: penicillin-binding protein 2 [Candidatus Magasanikbacteria bacterium]|nr:penicillin-binding protein 2 [Candidatus Magasanikbacteria bacterium]
MYDASRPQRRAANSGPVDFNRIQVATWFLFAGIGIIVMRLFFLMVWQHDFYIALAASAHETSSTLTPKRGEIFIQDSRTGAAFPVAINQDVYIMFADTRLLKTDEVSLNVANKIAEKFNYSVERKAELIKQLNKRTDPYEPIEQKLDQKTMEDLKSLKLTGIGFARVPQRYYPEKNLAASVIGFVGKNKDGAPWGKYGIEGYWQAELAGRGGVAEGLKGGNGIIQPKSLQPATDGTDLVLTIDRTLQYKACERLRQGMLEYNAESAAMVIMDPFTGAVLVMCSLPDFDPNNYSQVKSIDVFNNRTVFTPYEPGSIFKPIGMAAALNENVVAPTTPYTDTGRRDGVCQGPIQNAGNRTHGAMDMTTVIVKSINTGMVYVVDHLGKDKFVKYVKRFGFGVETGIDVDTEVSGTIDSLMINKGNKLDCYTGTASFGQGVTVTPLQMATAFSAIANGGNLMRPYIVKEKHFADGHTEITKPKIEGTVLTRRGASQIANMLVMAVDTGYAGRARVPGYRVAGKSGTAEIANSTSGGYTQTYNHSFIGFAPAENPKYVMIVKYEKPTKFPYAESTSAQIFGEMSKYLMEYYQVPPSRPIP